MFSSFAYLIDVSRILGAVMAAFQSTGLISDATIDDTDGRLVNWRLHLPEGKRDVLRGSGEVDEVLFFAHMNFNVLVLPRSHHFSVLRLGNRVGIITWTM